MRRLTSRGVASRKRPACHLRLVVGMSCSPNLDAARGIFNGLMMSVLFWLIAFMVMNV